MIVVFVSRDDAEYKAYERGYFQQTGGFASWQGKALFSYQVDNDFVVVVQGFEEKKRLAQDNFKSELIDPFVSTLTSKMAALKNLKDLNLNDEECRFFIHWGGGYGTVTDIENLARTALTNGESWSPNWFSYAISSRRPQLIDVKCDYIQLPLNRLGVDRLIQRAEDGALESFWTECVVLGKAANGAIVKQGQEYVGRQRGGVLRSCLDVEHKKRLLGDLDALEKYLKGECDSDEKDRAMSYLRSQLDEEAVYG